MSNYKEITEEWFVKETQHTLDSFNPLEGKVLYNALHLKNNLAFRRKDIQYLGSGASRSAFKYKDIVIKVPICKSGLIQNKKEKELSSTIRSPLLAETLNSIKVFNEEDFLIVMEYCTPLSDWIKNELREFLAPSDFDDFLFNRYSPTLDFNVRNALSSIIKKYEKKKEFNLVLDLFNYVLSQESPENSSISSCSFFSLIESKLKELIGNTELALLQIKDLRLGNLGVSTHDNISIRIIDYGYFDEIESYPRLDTILYPYQGSIDFMPPEAIN